MVEILQNMPLIHSVLAAGMWPDPGMAGCAHLWKSNQDALVQLFLSAGLSVRDTLTHFLLGRIFENSSHIFHF